MKRTILLLAVVLAAFVSCEKNASDTEDDNTKDRKTRYVFQNNLSICDRVINEGIDVTVELREYDSDDNLMATNMIPNTALGDTQTFVASDYSIKVKMFVITINRNIIDKNNTTRGWVNNIFLLPMNRTIKITLDDNFPQTSSEPK